MCSSDLEKLVQYVCRPPVATKRLSIHSRTGQVHYELKTPFDDGTTHTIMDPVDFLGRLAALVPPPRLNLIRFSGVFAPHSKYRSQIVPAPPEEVSKSKYKPPWPYLLKRIFDIDLEACKKCRKGRLKI